MQGRLGSIYIARTRDMSENPQDSANVHREYIARTRDMSENPQDSANGHRERY